MIVFPITALIFGFFGAAVIQKILNGPFGFRAEWNTTFIACTLTALISAVVFFMSFMTYDQNSSDHLMKAVATTAFISLLAGTLSCKLIIRSQSGPDKSSTIIPKNSFEMRFKLEKPKPRVKTTSPTPAPEAK